MWCVVVGVVGRVRPHNCTILQARTYNYNDDIIIVIISITYHAWMTIHVCCTMLLKTTYNAPTCIASKAGCIHYAKIIPNYICILQINELSSYIATCLSVFCITIKCQFIKYIIIYIYYIFHYSYWRASFYILIMLRKWLCRVSLNVVWKFGNQQDQTMADSNTTQHNTFSENIYASERKGEVGYQDRVLYCTQFFQWPHHDEAKSV